MKQTSLYKIQSTLKAKFGNFQGWKVPLCFFSLEKEDLILRNKVGLLDLSYLGIIELRGKDRSRFLHGMVTNDIKNLQVGRGCYALMLNPQGKILSDMRVLCLEETLLLILEPDLIEKTLSLLRKYIISEQVEATNLSSDLGVLSVQGPYAKKVVHLLNTKSDPPTSPFENFCLSYEGIRIHCARINRTIHGGYDLIINNERLGYVWNTLLENGSKLGLQPVGLEALDVQRLEIGTPSYGIDMDENRIPLEVDIDEAISYTKGCYIGQEVVARATYLGNVNRKLIGLLFSTKMPAEKGDKVFIADKEVGWISSSLYSPNLKRAIAFAYIRKEGWSPGTKVEVSSQSDLKEAIVTKRTFLK